MEAGWSGERLIEEARQSQLVDRMIRAARLDRTLYAEVTLDATATREALWVVIISAVASAVGSFLGILLAPIGLIGFTFGLGPVPELSGGLFGVAFLQGLIITPLLVIVGWLLWSAVAWFVGTRMIGTGTQDVEFMSVARSIGFAQAPGAVLIFSFVPILGLLVTFAVWLWLLATGFFAIRSSMRLTDGQAIATMIVGFIAYMIVFAVIGMTVLAGTVGGALIGAGSAI